MGLVTWLKEGPFAALAVLGGGAGLDPFGFGGGVGPRRRTTSFLAVVDSGAKETPLVADHVRSRGTGLLGLLKTIPRDLSQR